MLAEADTVADGGVRMSGIGCGSRIAFERFGRGDARTREVDTLTAEGLRATAAGRTRAIAGARPTLAGRYIQ